MLRLARLSLFSLVAIAPACGPSTQAVASATVTVTVCPSGSSFHAGQGCKPDAPEPPLPPAADDPPPVKTAAAATTLEYFVGRWIGDDSLGSSRCTLIVTADGRFTQEILTLTTERRDPGTCNQAGKITAEGGLTLTYEKNDCNREYEGKTETSKILHADHGSFEIEELGDYTTRYHRER